MRKILPLLLAIATAAAGIAAVPAQAQPADQGSRADIVVEGRRDVDRQINDFVKALTGVSNSGQISRFDWAVCPTVAGLAGRQNADAAQRMRQVARASGIRVAEPGCKTNVLVLVTDDTERLVKQLRSRHPEFFEGVSPREMQALRRGGPAAAWHIEGRLDADGREVPRDRLTGQYVVERTDVSSRLSTDSRPHFAAAIVVVDSDSLVGLTTVQLADYAAMRAFAGTDPSRLDNSAAPTILNVLEAPIGSAVPITLTSWDFAYLKALYSSTENRRAGQQRREMSREIAKELSRPNGD